MSHDAKGGDDTLTAGNNSGNAKKQLSVSNSLAGDANRLLNNAEGGDDTLIGGNNSGDALKGLQLVKNSLKGDAHWMQDNTQGGNDTLVGGNNNGNARLQNQFWGDTSEMRGGALRVVTTP